ncbi:MAG: hypothetical protein Gaeavirus42_2 [Gaeavirus sp.]|uniref:Uncharacterized protein n=1 Tax=Gaeavirus sp. TaxID=2487767 RepID=A0A3G4ZZS4_9VIRU|nr:MAG: hypothetical protein Gaeavirus42_2 [Gaeavirus sp.]
MIQCMTTYLATIDGTQEDISIKSSDIRELYIGFDEDLPLNEIYAFDDPIRLSMSRIDRYNLTLHKYIFTRHIEILRIYGQALDIMTDFTFMTNLKHIHIGNSYHSFITDYFSKPLTHFAFPLALESLHIYDHIDTDILLDMVLPINLKELTIFCDYKFPITSVTFNKNLKKLYLHSFSDITIPETIIHLGIRSLRDCQNLHKIEIPSTVKTLHIDLYTHEIDNILSSIKIPSNIIWLAISYITLLKHLIFESNIKKLEIYDDDYIASLNDLPYGIEKLVLHRTYIIEDITNLPMSLQKIKIIEDPECILSRIKKLPYGCIVVDKHNNIIMKN